MSRPRCAVRLGALLLCLVPAAGSAAAADAVAAVFAPLEVSAALDPAEVRVGDVARLTVTVDHPAGGALTLPEVERGRAVRVIDRQQRTAPFPGEADKGRERTIFTVSVTSFAVGEHAVGGGTVGWAGQAGGVLATPFPSPLLRTRSLVSGEDTPMRGPREPVRWPPPARRWPGLAVVAALLAAAILFGLRRRLQNRPTVPPAAAPVPLAPHEAALKAIAVVRRMEPGDREQFEKCFRELSSILRCYLEERFGLRAPERTTEELVREAAVSGQLAPPHQQLVREVLAWSDLVKFARHHPSRDDLSRALAVAERLVRETKPPVAQGPAARQVEVR